MDDNAEIVRDVFLAVSGGDPSAAFERFDPAVELDLSGVAGWPEKRFYRGLEVREFFQAWADSWQDWHFDLEDVRAGRDEQVFVAMHEWGTGAGSGASVDQRRCFVLTLRDGMATHLRIFSDRAAALAAAGLTG
jgi:ketosteroid isomerase-like protein